jgi:hypothetical protein
MAAHRPPQYEADRLTAYLAASKEHGLDFPKYTTEYAFEPPQSERFWCPVQRRPLTWQEAHYDGAGPRCGWCREGDGRG